MPQLLEVIGPKSGTAPLTYTVTEQGTVDLMSIFAHFDGAGASGSFRPTVTIRAQNGTILARIPTDETLATGDTADVTFAPFLRGAASSGGGVSTELAILNGGDTAITTFATTALTVFSDPSYPWIDFTDTAAPTVVDAGLYAMTFVALCTTANVPFYASLDIDSESIKSSAVFPDIRGSVSLVVPLNAGDAFRMRVQNRSANTRNFRVQQFIIVQIS